jgi:uncharacterized protein
MKIELESGLHDKNRISAYADDHIIVRDEYIRSSCVITADKILYSWKTYADGTVACSDFDPVISLGPEIILFGTGKNLVIPDMELCAYIQGKNIGFEFMYNGAAIRSYNILISEERNVAVALLLS